MAAISREQYISAVSEQYPFLAARITVEEPRHPDAIPVFRREALPILDAFGNPMTEHGYLLKTAGPIYFTWEKWHGDE